MASYTRAAKKIAPENRGGVKGKKVNGKKMSGRHKDVRSSREGGISPWISWVLIITFAVLLASMVSLWMKDYVSDTVDDLKDRTRSKEYCDLVGVDIEDIVARNAQTLNMKVINTYNLGVDRLIFRLYDADNNIFINKTNVTIKPGQNKTVTVPKNLTTYRVEVVPVILEDGKEIICKEKVVWKNITS